MPPDIAQVIAARSALEDCLDHLTKMQAIVQDRDRRLAKMELQLDVRQSRRQRNPRGVHAHAVGQTSPFPLLLVSLSDLRAIHPGNVSFFCAQTMEKETAEANVVMRRAVGELEITKAELVGTSSPSQGNCTEYYLVVLFCRNRRPDLNCRVDLTSADGSAHEAVFEEQRG